MIQDYTIFIDMDGVLAKWNVSATLDETHQRGYFRNRELETEICSCIKLLYQNGYDVRILSSAYEDDHSASDKMWWLENVADLHIPTIFVPYGNKKEDYIQTEIKKAILIDDYTRNLRSWVECGYIGIKFRNSVNGNFGTWKGPSLSDQMSCEELYRNILLFLSEFSAEGSGQLLMTKVTSL